MNEEAESWVTKNKLLLRIETKLKIRLKLTLLFFVMYLLVFEALSSQLCFYKAGSLTINNIV